MLAIALALGSSACYGVSNFLGPQLVRRHALVSVLVLSQAAALGACLLYLLGSREGHALPPTYVWLSLLAGVGNAGGLIGFYKAAELGPLSVAAPIGGLGAVIPVVWGLAGGEMLTATQLLGLVLAMTGGVLAARSSPQEEDRIDRYPDPRGSVMWAAGSAVAFGVFLTALPKATAHGRPWALFDSRLAMFTLLLIWAGPRLGTIRLRGSSAILAVPGLLLVSGTLMYTTATTHGQLSLVSVLGSLFPIFTVCLGMALLGERLSSTQTIGVATALTGIALIAL
jgi:drug/metabolite transporter (DMT)-like permease